MHNGVILAGGLGSRLGPISAQRSKALVSIGQRPHLIHQLQLLREADCQRVVVVVSPDTRRQVSDVVVRAGVPNVTVVVQEEPRGPVDAVRVAFDELAQTPRSTYVLMSDTFITEPLRGHTIVSDWIGVAPAPERRSFCYRELGFYYDAVVNVGQLVTIGAYHFTSPLDARACATIALARKPNVDEVGMAAFLNLYTRCRGGDYAELSIPTRTFSSWLDVGDVGALAHAHRSRFIARAHHRFEFDDAGLLWKYGEGDTFNQQADWLLRRQDHGLSGQQALFPRVFEAGSDQTSSYYAMEYVDLPTLAELWLYWPGRPDVWHGIFRRIIDQLDAYLWGNWQGYCSESELLWFVEKTRFRLRDVPEWRAEASELLALAEPFFTGSAPMVHGHGDLNFNNVLYSLNTGMIKLIDPRGDEEVPLLYELAKLRYSYHGGFAAITHGLADNDSLNGVRLWPERRAEIEALDQLFKPLADLDKLTLAEGCIMIAGAPLHTGVEGQILFERGLELMKQVLK